VAEAVAQAEVLDGEHVGAAGPDEEDLRGPAAHAADHSEAFDGGLVLEADQVARAIGNDAGQGLLGDVAQGEGLGGGEADLAESAVGQGQQLGGRGVVGPGREGDEAREDATARTSAR
jgi:hypothetical protein